jgi:hypothetical protein
LRLRLPDGDVAENAMIVQPQPAVVVLSKLTRVDIGGNDCSDQ